MQFFPNYLITMTAHIARRGRCEPALTAPGLPHLPDTVSVVYIGRQVIRESIMHLFPVGGVHPRIYFPWEVGSPPTDTNFFFSRSLKGQSDEEMVADREIRRPGGEFESTTGSVQDMGLEKRLGRGSSVWR